MKKMLFISLIVGAFGAFSAVPAFAEPAICAQYYKEMQVALKKDGNDTAAAMKIVREQVAGVPAGRQAEFCKSAIQSMKDAERHSAQDDDDDHHDKGNKKK